jgi:hypothetical protein
MKSFRRYFLEMDLYLQKDKTFSNKTIDPTEKKMWEMIRSFFTEEKSGLDQRHLKIHADKAMYMFANNYAADDTPNLNEYIAKTKEMGKEPKEKFPEKNSIDSYIYYKLISEYGT